MIINYILSVSIFIFYDIIKNTKEIVENKAKGELNEKTNNRFKDTKCRV